MADHDQRPGEVHQEVLQPGHTPVVQVVGGLIQQQDVRVAEQGLGQQHLELVACLKLGHEHCVLLRRDPQAGQQRRSVALRVPAVHLGKLAFQLRGLFPVRLAEVRLRVQRVLFLHDVVQPLVAHDDRIQNRIGVVHELVLLQGAHPLVRRDAHGAGRGLQFTAQDLQERGFAGAVRANDAIAVAGQELQVRAGKQLLSAEGQRNIAYCDHFRLISCLSDSCAYSAARRSSALA